MCTWRGRRCLCIFNHRYRPSMRLRSDTSAPFLLGGQPAHSTVHMCNHLRHRAATATQQASPASRSGSAPAVGWGWARGARGARRARRARGRAPSPGGPRRAGRAWRGLGLVLVLVSKGLEDAVVRTVIRVGHRAASLKLRVWPEAPPAARARHGCVPTLRGLREAKECAEPNAGPMNCGASRSLVHAAGAVALGHGDAGKALEAAPVLAPRVLDLRRGRAGKGWSGCARQHVSSTGRGSTLVRPGCDFSTTHDPRGRAGPHVVASQNNGVIEVVARAAARRVHRVAVGVPDHELHVHLRTFTHTRQVSPRSLHVLLPVATASAPKALASKWHTTGLVLSCSLSASRPAPSSRM